MEGDPAGEGAIVIEFNRELLKAIFKFMNSGFDVPVINIKLSDLYRFASMDSMANGIDVSYLLHVVQNILSNSGCCRDVGISERNSHVEVDEFEERIPLEIELSEPERD